MEKGRGEEAMWGQMEGVKKLLRLHSNEQNWPVARHGSFQHNKDKVQIEGNQSVGAYPCLHPLL